MTEQVPINDPGASKRRSTRIVQAVPITVTGTDALGQPFKERTSTLIINCHGFKYQSKHYVLKNTWLEVEIPNPQPGEPPRKIRGCVTFVQRPRTVRELFQLGVEFETPGNVWGVAFPPDDWFPLETSAATEPQVPAPAAPRPPEAPPRMAPVIPVTEAPGPRAVIPDRIMAELPVSISRQIARMVTDAQHQFQRAAREAIANAMASETERLFRDVNEQMRLAAAKAVEAAAADYADQAVRRMLHKMEETRQASMAETKEAWARTIEIDLQEATKRLMAQLEESASGLRSDWLNRVKADMEESLRKLAEIEQRMAGLQGVAESSAVEARALVQSLRSEIESLAEETRRKLNEQAQTHAENESARRAEIEAQAQEAQNKLTARIEELEQKEEAHQAEMESAAAQLMEEVRRATQAALQVWQGKMDEMAKSAMSVAEQNVAARASELSARAAQEVAAQAEKCVAETTERMRAAGAALDEQIARGHACAAQIDATASRIEELSHGAVAEFNRRFNSMLVAQNEELTAQVDRLISTLAERLTPELESKGAEIKARVLHEIEQHLTPQIERARAMVEELVARQAKAAEVLEQEKVAMRAAADEISHQALAAFRAMTEQLEKGFHESARGIVNQCMEELDAKSTETTHTTFESLYKSADWYQKKAQTAMHNALEKAVGEAATHLRDKAAEISGIFVSELDHYSRSYVEHTQGLLEEAAREMAARLRAQFQETMDATAARMGDEAHRLAA
ncbi:MAG TPA: hypothetical protein VNL38_00465, partial [Candidatus Nitrosotenuis sp.]|nr:hypothetical protein [Candidatus Nitrosotenuis sp.]